jgi:hypothetical protein
MSHLYTVAAGERTLMHVQADSKAEARRVALDDVTVTRLDASQAIDLTRRGIAIVDAKTGKVCNAAEPNVVGAGDTNMATQP